MKKIIKKLETACKNMNTESSKIDVTFMSHRYTPITVDIYNPSRPYLSQTDPSLGSKW